MRAHDIINGYIFHGLKRTIKTLWNKLYGEWWIFTQQQPLFSEWKTLISFDCKFCKASLNNQTHRENLFTSYRPNRTKWKLLNFMDLSNEASFLDLSLCISLSLPFWLEKPNKSTHSKIWQKAIYWIKDAAHPLARKEYPWNSFDFEVI